MIKLRTAEERISHSCTGSAGYLALLRVLQFTVNFQKISAMATVYEFLFLRLLTLAAPFVNIQFLGSSLTFMMVSVRRLIRENCSQMDVGEVHRSHSMAYAGLRLGQT